MEAGNWSFRGNWRVAGEEMKGKCEKEESRRRSGFNKIK